METFTKYGIPVWNNVIPTQYIISEPTKVRKSRFLKVAASDLNILVSDGLVSTNSFSLRRKVGSIMQTQAMIASAIKQMR